MWVDLIIFEVTVVKLYPRLSMFWGYRVPFLIIQPSTLYNISGDVLFLESGSYASSHIFSTENTAWTGRRRARDVTRAAATEQKCIRIKLKYYYISVRRILTRALTAATTLISGCQLSWDKTTAVCLA